MKEEYNISQELFETIERFLNETMKANEKKEFEASIKKDKILKQQVDDLRIILNGIENVNFKNKMDEFHKEINKSENKLRVISKNPNSNYRLFYTIAATLIIAFGLFWMFQPISNSDKIIASYYTQDPGLPTIMSNNQDFEFYNGMVKYKQKKYPLAIQIWEELLISKNKNDTLNYFIGVSYLAENKPEIAISFLEKVTQSKKSVFLNDAYYNLGFSNLKVNNKEEAIINFRKSNYPESTDILNELE